MNVWILKSFKNEGMDPKNNKNESMDPENNKNEGMEPKDNELKVLRAVQNVSVWLILLFFVAQPLKRSTSFHNGLLGPKEGEHIFETNIQIPCLSAEQNIYISLFEYK